MQLRLQGAWWCSLSRASRSTATWPRSGPPGSLREALQEDPTLWELLETPLMLHVVTLAYAGQPVEALRDGTTPASGSSTSSPPTWTACSSAGAPASRYTRLQTERWLAWLAWQMTQHGQTIFYLEHMQPDWLPVGQRWLPTHGARLLAGLVGLGAGLLGGLFGERGGGLVFGLSAGLLGRLAQTQQVRYQGQ